MIPVVTLCVHTYRLVAWQCTDWNKAVRQSSNRCERICLNKLSQSDLSNLQKGCLVRVSEAV